MTVQTILIAAGIPSAICGFFIWMLKQQLVKSEHERENREKQRQDFMMAILDGVNASMGLAEATARAVERIPDAHCNGDMHAALRYAEKVRREQREFLARTGIESMI